MVDWLPASGIGLTLGGGEAGAGGGAVLSRRRIFEGMNLIGILPP
jgi:hypothetical protein